YAARRVADFLITNQNFVRPGDGPLAPALLPPPGQAAYLGGIMQKWPKYTALGSMGPDLFFTLMDLREIPGDEVMLALAAVYLMDDSQRSDWEPLLAIMAAINQPFANALRFMIALDKAWQPVAAAFDKVASAVGSVVDAVTGQMLSTIQTYLGELRDAVATF